MSSSRQLLDSTTVAGRCQKASPAHHHRPKSRRETTSCSWWSRTPSLPACSAQQRMPLLPRTSFTPWRGTPRTGAADLGHVPVGRRPASPPRPPTATSSMSRSPAGSPDGGGHSPRPHAARRDRPQLRRGPHHRRRPRLNASQTCTATTSTRNGALSRAGDTFVTRPCSSTQAHSRAPPGASRRETPWPLAKRLQSSART